MKIKNLFVAITVSVLGILGFTACLTEGSNSSNTPYASPVVIEYNNLAVGGGIYLCTAYGVFIPDNASAAKLLTLLDYQYGTCGIVYFDYNSEYQTEQYQNIASNVDFQAVDVDNISTENAEMINSYTYPFSSVDLLQGYYNDNVSISEFYKGRFFIGTTAKLGTNQTLRYYYYIKSNEQLDGNGARNIYLQAMLPTEPVSSAQDVSTTRALDIRNMLYSFGRDTTIHSNTGTDYYYRYLKINLNYCSGTDNGTPVFKSVATQPIFIAILRDDLY